MLSRLTELTESLLNSETSSTLSTMTKADAIRLFETQAGLARALGITRAAIAQWPDELTQRQADEVTGAAVRMNKLPAPAAEPQQAA